MSHSAEPLGPVIKIQNPELTEYAQDAEENKKRSWYDRKYVILESSPGPLPGQTKQKLAYRDLSVWENIKALVGYGPTSSPASTC